MSTCTGSRSADHAALGAGLAALASALEEFANARDWGRFHSPKNLAMALSVEASELLEHFQWLTEGESGALDGNARTEVAHELADVLIYLTRLADRLEVDLAAAVEEKMRINEARYPASRVRGSAAKYTTYE